MTTTAEPSTHREQLSAMILELQANRVVLDRLSKQFAMFRFTGGTIPAQGCSTSGMASYLARSWVAESIATEDVERYRALIGTLAELQLNVSTAAGPRTLRVRFAITEVFSRALSEILPLGNHLETAVKRALEAAEPLSSIH
jgi:hypothetical protein